MTSPIMQTIADKVLCTALWIPKHCTLYLNYFFSLVYFQRLCVYFRGVQQPYPTISAELDTIDRAAGGVDICSIQPCTSPLLYTAPLHSTALHCTEATQVLSAQPPVHLTALLCTLLLHSTLLLWIGKYLDSTLGVASSVEVLIFIMILEFANYYSV